MAGILDILTKIFALVGLLAITFIALYYIAKAIQSYKPSSTSSSQQSLWPNAEYMQKVGAVCPTGWVYKGTTSNGRNICQNAFQIPIGITGGTCYDDSDNSIKYFTPIKEWNKCQTPNQCPALKERCDWITSCGPPADTRDPSTGDQPGQNPYASWIGVANKC